MRNRGQSPNWISGSDPAHSSLREIGPRPRLFFDILGEPMKEAQGWLDAFAAALSLRVLVAVSRLFRADCYWRDLVAFTWNIRTSEGPVEVQAMLAATLGVAEPSSFRIISYQSSDGIGEAWFSFETAVGRGIGHVRLKKRRAWTLLTT